MLLVSLEKRVFDLPCPTSVFSKWTWSCVLVVLYFLFVFVFSFIFFPLFFPDFISLSFFVLSVVLLLHLYSGKFTTICPNTCTATYTSQACGRFSSRKMRNATRGYLDQCCFRCSVFYPLLLLFPSFSFFFLFFFRSNWMCRSEDNNALKFSDGSFVYNVRSKHWKLENSFFSFSILNRWLVNHFCSAGFNIFYVSLVAFETGIFCIFSFFSFV